MKLMFIIKERIYISHTILTYSTFRNILYFVKIVDYISLSDILIKLIIYITFVINWFLNCFLVINHFIFCALSWSSYFFCLVSNDVVFLKLHTQDWLLGSNLFLEFKSLHKPVLRRFLKLRLCPRNIGLFILLYYRTIYKYNVFKEAFKMSTKIITVCFEIDQITNCFR